MKKLINRMQKNHIVSSAPLLICSGKHYPYLRRPISSQQHLTSRMAIYSTWYPPSKPYQEPTVILLRYQNQTNMIQMGVTHYPTISEISARPMESQDPNKARRRGSIQHHQSHIPRCITNSRTYKRSLKTTNQI